MSESESVTRGEQLVERTFLAPNPPTSRLPHTLVKGGQNTLRALSVLVGTSLGLWGERPLFRADGGHYLEPENGKITVDFALWKLEANQRYLLTRANVGPNPGFKMFISADTPVRVLERTYLDADNQGDSPPWFGTYINYVQEWIDDLRWALIPLEGEIGWDILVGARDLEPIVLSAKSEFQKNGIAVAHLMERNGRALWIDD